MTRLRKTTLIIAGSAVGLCLILFTAAITVAHTRWFREFVRQKVISAVDEATGGKTEIHAFVFDPSRLRAEIDDFVLHGSESREVAPLFHAKKLVIDLKLFSIRKGFFNVTYLLVDSPQAHVIVYPNGQTNLPKPPPNKQSSNSNGLQTIVDLAIGRFDLVNGSFTAADRKVDFDANGNNLLAQLHYDWVRQRYVGELDLSPLHLRSGGNAPLDVDVKLPLSLETDRVALTNARLNTPKSAIQLSASLVHLAAPRASAQMTGDLALEEIRGTAGLKAPLDTTRGPSRLRFNIRASADERRIVVDDANLELGHSSIKASGRLKDGNRPGALQFSSVLSLGEIGKLLRVSAQPDGTLQTSGDASLNPDGGYRVRASVNGRNLAAGQGSGRVTGGTLVSSITADPQRIEIGGLRLSVLGGRLVGSGAVENMKSFHFAGKLDRFDIQGLSAIFKPGGVGYSGSISGDVQVEGSTKNSSQIDARAALTIQPRAGGVPVSGRIDVNYSGRGDTVVVAPSYLVLPNTRLDLSGSLGQQIQLKLVTRNTADFRPIAAVPVTFTSGGNASVNASIRGVLSVPQIDAGISLTNFSVEGRAFTSLTASLVASPSGASISNATLSRGMMRAEVNGSVGLHDWKATNNNPVRADVTVREADLADLLALSGHGKVAAQGALSADVHLAGSVLNPVGTASVTVTNGSLEDEPFDSLTARAVLTPNSVEVPTLQWLAGPARLEANAAYQHAPNDLRRGRLRVHVASNQMPLAQFQSLLKDRPGLGGVLTLAADGEAAIGPAADGTDFQLTMLNANLSAGGLQMQGKNLGDATVIANTNGSSLRYNLSSNFAGSRIRVEGQSLLSGDHQTSATAEIANLPIDRLLAVAGRRDLPVNGTITMNAQVSGTPAGLRGGANLAVSNGSAYQQPFNRLQASVTYSSRLIELSQFHLQDGPNDIQASGSFAHPANSFYAGQVRLRVRSNQLQLARIRAIQQAKAGLTGTLEISADADGTIGGNSGAEFAMLNANLGAKSLAVNGKALGDATLTAESRGQDVAVNLRSNFASADIRGDATLGLAGDHQVNAKLSFSNVTYSGLSNWIGSTASTFDASTEGQLTVSGPATQLEGLRGSLQLTKLEAHSVNSGKAAAKPRVQFELHNQGPVAVQLDHSTVTVQNARITGPYANLVLSGSAPLKGTMPMNLRADGNLQVELLEALDSRIFASGAVTLNASVTGRLAKPSVNGRLQLQDVSFNMADVPNGVSGAKGTVTFTGTDAIIQNITAESGGGKLTLSGVVGYGGPEATVRVQARAERVHIRYPDTVTTQASAQLSLDGTVASSLLSGTVRISEVALHSHTDIGSMLTSAATPPSSSSASSRFLAGMKFNVRVLTTSGVRFRTALAQNLQADADVVLRGTPNHPGMLGRVTIDQGQLVFFGSKYNVDQGTISFFDPNQVQPILNVSLSTTVQGVSVTLSVSGPADKMTLSYHSDPPMEFKDIVSLLGSGKPPTSDPVLAARETPPPQQSVAQAGASMLLGQAVASPVSGRLQRLFGVSKLKVDPQVVGASGSPTATLTLEQQINNKITFTYIQDLTQSNPQTVRVEWALDPQWSAILGRDVTGEVNVDLFYKRRFH